LGGAALALKPGPTVSLSKAEAEFR